MHRIAFLLPPELAHELFLRYLVVRRTARVVLYWLLLVLWTAMYSILWCAPR